MFWKKHNETEKKLKQLNEILKRSFSNVKKDTTNIFQWMDLFYKKIQEQERRNFEQTQLIRQLQLELSYMPRTREDIRRIVDQYYSFESIMTRIKDMDYKIGELAKSQTKELEAPKPMADTAQQQKLQELSAIERRLESLEHRKSAVKEKIVQKFTRNSKEYIKSIIVSYIKKYGKISALQLKEMVVDEQNFCSKSSFYRLLDEIEELEYIGVVKSGKEKHYISKIVKNI